MTDSNISLSAVVKLEATPPTTDVFSPESAKRAAAWVRKAAKGFPLLGGLDIGPGVVGELARALSSPVTDVLVTAWNKRAEILKYADPRQLGSEETHEVSLYDHEVKETVTPSVEVLLAGQSVVKFAFPCAVTLALHGAVLVIRAGKVMQLRLGDLKASWKLSARVEPGGALEVIAEDIADVRLRGTVRLGDGIRIPARGG